MSGQPSSSQQHPGGGPPLPRGATATPPLPMAAAAANPAGMAAAEQATATYPGWATRDMEEHYEKIEKIGEGTYGEARLHIRPATRRSLPRRRPSRVPRNDTATRLDY